MGKCVIIYVFREASRPKCWSSSIEYYSCYFFNEFYVLSTQLHRRYCMCCQLSSVWYHITHSQWHTMLYVSIALDYRQRTGSYLCALRHRSTGLSSYSLWWSAYYQGMQIPKNTRKTLENAENSLLNLILINFFSSLIVHIRFIVRVAQAVLWPDDILREIIHNRNKKRANSDLLVTWSRSTSASSIYRYNTFRE